MTESNNIEKTYSALMAKAKELVILQSMGAIVYWDMETKMPPKGIDLRSQQLALLQQIGHRMLTDPENGKLIDEIVNNPGYNGLTQLRKRNVHLAKKEYDEATKLPEELVVETARQSALTVDVWKKAKAARDWGMFKPDLEKLFELRAKAADILMDVKGTETPYDALIDIYEPKMTADTISKVFDEMREGLVDIIGKCRDAPRQPETAFLSKKVPLDAQVEIAEAIADIIGYDIKSEKAGGTPRATTTTSASPPTTTRTGSPPASSQRFTRGATPCTSRTSPAIGCTSPWGPGAAWESTSPSPGLSRTWSAAAPSSGPTSYPN